jgi:hypothetical protein
LVFLSSRYWSENGIGSWKARTIVDEICIFSVRVYLHFPILPSYFRVV